MSRQAANAQDLVVIGKVGKAHGIRGEIKIWPATPGADVMLDLDTVLIGNTARNATVYTLQRCRVGGKAFVVSMKELGSRNDAERLTGQSVWIDPDDLPVIEDDDEFYFHQLKDLPVMDDQGQQLGNVVGILDAGGADVLVIYDDSTNDEIMIPFVEEMIQVDLEAGQVLATPPEGLVEATRSPRRGKGKASARGDKNPA